MERRCRQGQDGGTQVTAWHSLALTCPRTCGLCDDTSPTSCQLPTSWRGSWIDGASGAAVAINETAMYVSRPATGDEDQNEVDGLTMGCVRWRTDTTSEDDLTMLVTVYGAGCRPRYRCVRVLRQSASLLYLQLSDASSWPIIRSPREPVDCRAFHFDRWTASPPAVSASAGSGSTTSGYLLSLVAVDVASVDCRLPPDVVGLQYEAEFVVDSPRARDRCIGTLTESDGSLRLAVLGCQSAITRLFVEPVYKCLESSTVPDSDSDLVIITSSGSRSDSSFTLSCWLFTHITRRGRGRASSTLSFYLLTGDQCHTAVASRSPSSFLPSRQLIYTAFFSRPRLLSTTTVSRPQVTVSQTPSLTEPVLPSTVWTSKRPRPRNMTVADSDEDDQSGGFANAFVVGVVAVLMAVIQLILLCRC